jgi:hypothetical protein
MGDSGSGRRHNVLKQPMQREMQNHVLALYVFQLLRLHMQMKSNMKMTAPAVEGRYFHRK